MLTRLVARNFKRFGEVEIELGNPVVFIGPNNSGKTSAMQALALWDVGLKRWNEKRSGRSTPEKRPGVTVNRRDLVAVPIPDANLLWRGMHVRDVRKIEGRQTTSNVRIDLVVEGVTRDKHWTCGLEFDYANEESFYCRPGQPGPEGVAGDRVRPVLPGGADRLGALPRRVHRPGEPAGSCQAIGTRTRAARAREELLLADDPGGVCRRVSAGRRGRATLCGGGS